MRPAGAKNYLRWRRSIDEHLELRRLTWDEYGMFSWLCTKADPRAGSFRTSWRTLAEQTTLTANYVEKLARNLKRKGYIAYPNHRGRRHTLVEIAIDKFPLPDGSYTTLSNPGVQREAELPARLPTELPAELPAELEAQNAATARTSQGGRIRKRKRIRSTLRVREADPADPKEPDQILDPGRQRGQDAVGVEAAHSGGDLPRGEAQHDDEAAPAEPPLTREMALAAAPSVLRETLELFFLKTGREDLAPDELDALRELDATHTPAVIQKTITAAVQRFTRRGQPVSAITVRYVQDSLRHFTTRRSPGADLRRQAAPQSKYPDGVTRLW